MNDTALADPEGGDDELIEELPASEEAVFEIRRLHNLELSATTEARMGIGDYLRTHPQTSHQYADLAQRVGIATETMHNYVFTSQVIDSPEDRAVKVPWSAFSLLARCEPGVRSEVLDLFRETGATVEQVRSEIHARSKPKARKATVYKGGMNLNGLKITGTRRGDTLTLIIEDSALEEPVIINSVDNFTVQAQINSGDLKISDEQIKAAKKARKLRAV